MMQHHRLTIYQCRAEGEVMHRMECFYVKKLSHLILNMEVLMLLRILIMRWLERLSAAKAPLLPSSGILCDVITDTITTEGKHRHTDL